MELTAKTPIQHLKGVGERRAALFRKLHITTLGDLLHHFPRDYIDLSNPVPLAAAPPMELCAIRAKIVHKSPEQRVRSGLSIFKMRIEDASATANVIMFNCRYTVETMQLGEEYLFYGKVGGSLLQREMSAPTIYDLPLEYAILPVYPQTAGLNSKFLRRCILQALPVADAMPDILPVDVRTQHGLPDYATSIRSIHFPPTLASAKQAQARFVFAELLVLSCAMGALRAEKIARKITPLGQVDLAPFYNSLPFTPTGAQLRCVKEAVQDMTGDTPMNRLIQGDVGSGKTLVAAACVYFVAGNSGQSALMAPTEILAEQHLATLQGMLQGFGLRTALLTGSTKTAERRAILAELAEGQIDLLVGTHALLSDGVEFHNLRLVVTDEQHRFGVSQRAKLSQKSEDAHVLVMSATPIPRTLALIVYGDLQLSIIDELPPHRQPVETLLINSKKRERALGFIRNALDQGQQAYIICPLIEQGSTDSDLKPAMEYHQTLQRGALKGYHLGLLHGRMKAAEKEEAMRRFKSGEIQALVSTTVVEVGVDVPNATIILIENAERFGLSQLHQLRGRVGRGAEKSWCILITDSHSKTTLERLQVMKKTSDGFEVAEYDLQLRGPGDFLGHRQHGLPDLPMTSLSGNADLMDHAHQCAENILLKDPDLALPAHQHLAGAVGELLATVGERPN